jgi:hypothetical protein
VALLFLTRGYLQHHDTWALWFGDAQGLLPVQAIQKAACTAETISAAGHTCGTSGGKGPLQQQHLYTVYVHVGINEKDFKGGCTSHHITSPPHPGAAAAPLLCLCPQWHQQRRLMRKNSMVCYGIISSSYSFPAPISCDFLAQFYALIRSLQKSHAPAAAAPLLCQRAPCL